MVHAMLKRVLGWIGNLLFILVLILCLSTIYTTVQAKNAQDNLPSVFGYKMMRVLTGSMEPILNPGDLILVKSIDANKVKIDDVITFKNSENTFVTHRVIDLNLKEGKIFFETKGDANNIKDEEAVFADALIGTLRFNLPKAGYVIDFLRRPIGLVILVLVPLLYLTIGVLKRVFTDTKNVQGREIKVKG